MSLFGNIRWVSDPEIPEGEVSFFRDGKLVWHGSLDEPFDDVDMDQMHLSPRDSDRLKQIIERGAQGDRQ